MWFTAGAPPNLGSKMRSFRGFSKKRVFWPFSLRKMPKFDPYAENHTEYFEMTPTMQYRNNIKNKKWLFFYLPKKLFIALQRRFLDFQFWPPKNFWPKNRFFFAENFFAMR